MATAPDSEPGHPTSSHAPRPTLSIIIPAYNEAGRIGAALASIRDYAQRTGRSCEVIVVDDGSTDGTADVVRRFAEGSQGSQGSEDRQGNEGSPGLLAIQLLVSPANMGKGHAIRRGMLQASGQALLMSDADQSAPIWEVEKLLAWLAGEEGAVLHHAPSPPGFAKAAPGRRPPIPEGEGKFDVVIGSRRMPQSVVCPPRTAKRRLMAWTFHLIRRCILLADLRDTQCGFKCFTRAAALEVFDRLKATGFEFDCEALGLARRMGYRIKEVGIAWSDSEHSRFRTVRDSLRMLVSLPAICWRVRRVRGPQTR